MAVQHAEITRTYVKAHAWYSLRSDLWGRLSSHDDTAVVRGQAAAMLGAFINRFAIGVVIGASTLPLSGWMTGLLFGLLLSLPDAIITKAYAPILGLGIIGGLLIGFVVARWGV